MPRTERWKALDRFRRAMYLKNELKRVVLGGILRNTALPAPVRYFAFYGRLRLPRASVSCRPKIRCLRTGRIWAVERGVRVSRFVFRSEANLGGLPGVSRASW